MSTPKSSKRDNKKNDTLIGSGYPSMAPFIYSPFTGFNYAYNPQTGFYEFHTGTGIIHLYNPGNGQYTYVQQPMYQQPMYQQPTVPNQPKPEPNIKPNFYKEIKPYYKEYLVRDPSNTLTFGEFLGIKKSINTNITNQKLKDVSLGKIIFESVKYPNFSEFIDKVYTPRLKKDDVFKDLQRVDPSELPPVGSRWYYKSESSLNPDTQYVIGADREYKLEVLSVEDQKVITKVTWTKGNIMTNVSDEKIFYGNEWTKLPNKEQIQKKTETVTEPIIPPVKEAVTPKLFSKGGKTKKQKRKSKKAKSHRVR